MHVRDLDNELWLRNANEGRDLNAREILDKSYLHRRALLDELYARELAKVYEKRGMIAARDPREKSIFGPDLSVLSHSTERLCWASLTIECRGNLKWGSPQKGSGDKHSNSEYHTYFRGSED